MQSIFNPPLYICCLIDCDSFRLIFRPPRSPCNFYIEIGKKRDPVPYSGNGRAVCSDISPVIEVSVRLLPRDGETRSRSRVVSDSSSQVIGIGIQGIYSTRLLNVFVIRYLFTGKVIRYILLVQLFSTS